MSQSPIEKKLSAMAGSVLCQGSRTLFEMHLGELMQLGPSPECLQQFAQEQLKDAITVGISSDELGVLRERLGRMVDEEIVDKAYTEAIACARAERKPTKVVPPRYQRRLFTVAGRYAQKEIPVHA